MAQETFGNLCPAIFDDETRLHSVGTRPRLTPRAQRSPPNRAFALPLAICAAIFGGNCASQVR